MFSTCPRWPDNTCSSFNLMDSKRQTFMDHIYSIYLQCTAVLHIYSTMNYKFKISVMVDGGVG